MENDEDRKLWEFYKVSTTTRKKLIEMKTSLEPKQEAVLFQALIQDLFFNTRAWIWLWAYNDIKTSSNPIYKTYNTKDGYIDQIPLIFELSSRLLAKVKNPTPEPEAFWVFKDKITVITSHKKYGQI